ncbi:nickel ABC transporter, nickel/metallophore periplasmic binding protein [Helicobacter sp. MIT 05-5293]|uniref:nickel ABC transporter substrate-binding protein n=1 Tax=Helicobacter sp. MIT 05-5293 TaxID=1548149 RepID=UPI00051CD0E0|nr:nickel ABC transporter substrate-binding protein [Helicobacter sp. MIT 05-5293]TLD79774.1 nickel ABC transporter, nickel/metallophore periplasmic binding protein [Helicobacter sp. MIT 05-5293]
MKTLQILCVLLTLSSVQIYAKTLTLVLSRNVGVMNPQGYAFNEMFAQNMIYEGLVKIDSDGKIIPSLATSWEIKEKGKVYIFHLRKNVRFSNGEIFDAAAAKKNFDSILTNKIRHSWSNLSLLIQDVRIIDDLSLQITLSKPYAPTLTELSLIRPYRFIAPSMIPNDLNLITHNPKEPIGTGPYQLTKTELGKGDTFTKNPHYWDKEHYKGIYFDTIQTKIIIEPNAKLIALKTAQADIIYGSDEIPIEIFKKISQTKEFATYLSPPIATTALVLNPKNEILSSLTMRQALAYGIDKHTLIKAVYGDFQQSADYLFAPNLPYCNVEADFTPLTFVPQKAKELIESLGYTLQNGFYNKNGKNLVLELIYIGNNPAQKAMAEILQQQLKNIGIFLKLTPYEQSIFRNHQAKGTFDISFNETWGIPYEPFIMLNSMRYAGHIDYIVQKFLQSPTKDEIDKEIQAVISLPETQIQKPLKDLLIKLYQTQIYIPLTYQRNKAIARKNIRGVNPDMRHFEIPLWEFYE